MTLTLHHTAMMKTVAHQISLDSSTITRILAIMALLLIATSIAGQISRFIFEVENLNSLIRLFNVDEERNIPTYFSMLLMIFIASLLAIIATLNSKLGFPHVSKWVVLSCGFWFMAYDEVFQIHEKLIWPFRALLGDTNLGAFYFAWVIPGITIVFVSGLFFLKFLLYLPAIVRSRFLFAAVLYLGGAIGLELIGGQHVELHGEENFIYSLITTIEESLEIFGLIFFIWTLLKYCEEHYQAVQLRFTT